MIEDTSQSMDHELERPRGRWLRRAVVAAVVLGAGALLYPSVSRWARSERSVSAAQIRLGQVVRGDLVRDLSVDGRVVAAFHPTLFSPARGVVRLQARAGAVVEAGQVLAVVDSPELESRLKQAESLLESLTADLRRQTIAARQANLQNAREVELYGVRLEAAERAMERAERSREQGILNEVEYEEAEVALRLARLEVENAERKASFEEESLAFEVSNRRSLAERQRLGVEELRRQVAELSLRSPVAGQVARLDVQDHDAVETGQPVLGVVDLSAFELEILVPEGFADEIGPGTGASVTYEGREWPAEVQGVAPEVEGSRVRGTVTFVGEAPQGLRQSQRLPTRLVFETRRDVLKLPRGSFLEGAGDRRVYVVEDGVAELRRLEIGAISVSEVEVLAGLEEGETVIVSDTRRFEGAETLLVRD